jgi:hypothetical protein
VIAAAICSSASSSKKLRSSMWQAGLIFGGGEGEGRIVGADVAGNGFVIDGLAEDAASQRAVLRVP